MPAAQFITSGLERALNQFVKLDPDSAIALRKLEGKQLEVSLNELPLAVVLVFSQRIDLLAREKDSELDQADCKITLAFSTLDKLQDSSQLTKLIQAGELELDGDIHIAQVFSQLIKDLQIDWEEQLSKYTGDVIAHSVFEIGSGLVNKAKNVARSIALTLKDGAMEEKPIAAHPFAVEDFCQQVSDLRSDTERLEARLKELESQCERS